MNLVYSLPYLRRLYIKYLTKWANDNIKLTVEKKIYKKIMMSLVIKDWVQRYIFINGIYEPEETKLWYTLSKKYSNIYDVGANVGYYSLLAAKANPNANIFAFEPVNQTYKKLKQNIELNSFKNIKAIKKGVSDSLKTIDLHIGNDSNWGMSSVHTHNQLSGKTERVECITIDHFAEKNKCESVDMIKIDIEGSELSAIKGMTKTIQRDKPDIFIEILDEHLLEQGKTSKDLYELLWRFGYKSYSIDKGLRLSQINDSISKNGLIYFTTKMV